MRRCLYDAMKPDCSAAVDAADAVADVAGVGTVGAMVAESPAQISPVDDLVDVDQRHKS